MSRETQPNAEDRSTKRIYLVGMGLSLLAVALPWFLGDLDLETDILLSVAFLSLGYLVTMDLALRERAKRLEDRIYARLEASDGLRYGALPLQRLHAVPEIERPLVDIIESIARAKSSRMPFLANRTVECINRSRDEAGRVAAGSFYVSEQRQERELVRLALLDTRGTLKAVAGLGLSRWREHHFQLYFGVYLEADHLDQSRVFLIERAEINEPDMIALLERHARKGVRTFALDRSRLPTGLRRPLVLFDDELLLAHSRQDADSMRVEVQFTDEPRAISAAVEDFEELMHIALLNDGETVLWSSDTDFLGERIDRSIGA